LLADAEMKIARVSRVAFKEMPVMEGATAMLQAPLPLDLIGMNDFHDFSCTAPRPMRSSYQVAASDDIEQACV
jgi:hypothetical protein